MTIEFSSLRRMPITFVGPRQLPVVAKRVYLQLIAASFLFGMSSTAPAYENHEMWEKVRTRGKLCMRTHEHYGESPAWPSKKGARKYARRAWESFTTWEYGKAWGKLRLAAGKREKCKQAGSRWICSPSMGELHNLGIW